MTDAMCLLWSVRKTAKHSQSLAGPKIVSMNIFNRLKYIFEKSFEIWCRVVTQHVKPVSILFKMEKSFRRTFQLAKSNFSWTSQLMSMISKNVVRRYLHTFQWIRQKFRSNRDLNSILPFFWICIIRYRRATLILLGFLSEPSSYWTKLLEE